MTATDSSGGILCIIATISQDYRRVRALLADVLATEWELKTRKQIA
jgi:hypothetical protein